MRNIHLSSVRGRRATRALSALIACLLAGSVAAAPGQLDLRFGDNGVATIGGESDGDDAVNKLLPDGNASVFAVGSLFETIPATAGKGIATGNDMAVVRLRDDGTPDPLFGDGGVSVVHAGGDGDEAFDIARQDDGKLLVAGALELESYRDFGVARLLPDGSIDDTYGNAPPAKGGVRRGFSVVNMGPANANDVARAVALQSTGKAIVAGDGVFAEVTGNYPRFGLMRLDENGDLDPTFGPNGDGRLIVPAITIQTSEYLSTIARRFDGSLPANDSILVVGTVSARNTAILRRYTANGAPDPSFGTNGLVTVTETNVGGVRTGLITIVDAVIQNDGKIVVLGEAGDRGFVFLRFNNNGTPDASFGNNGRQMVKFSALSSDYDTPTSLALQANGKLVASGNATVRETGQAPLDFMMVRLLPNGQPDLAFGPNGIRVYPVSDELDSSNAVAVMGHGQLLFAGVADVEAGSGGDMDMAFLRLQGDPDIFADGFED